MKKIILLSILCLAFVSEVCAQEINEKQLLINSGDLLQKGLEANKKGEYKTAITYYQQISRNDTNYVVALTELSVSFIADSQFIKAAEVCLEALKDPHGEECNLYSNLGTAYDGATKYELAETAYKKGLTYAPYDYSILYNLGVLYENMKMPEKAFETYKKALQYNPFHAGSLDRIGRLELAKGHTVTAMMAFYTSLVCSPGSKYLRSNLLGLDDISNVKLKLSNGSSSRTSDNFYELELLLASKIALSPKFKNETKIADPIINQTQMVIDKLEFNPKDTGYFMQIYVPFFIAIKEKKYFPPFIYQAFHGTNSAALQSAYKKNEKTIELFKTWVYTYWHEKRQKQTILVDGKPKLVTFYYTSDHLQAIGEYDKPNTEGKKHIGIWTYYYRNGYKEAEGLYREGLKDGVWKYYDFTGVLTEIATYKNGDYNGIYEKYAKNGQVISRVFLVDNKIQGTVEGYNQVGNLLYEKNIVENKQEGETKTYFLSGGIDNKLNYKAALLEGQQVLYYSSGVIWKKLMYKNDALDGLYEEYHENGILKKKGQYVVGNATGVWMAYYDNKQLFDSGAYNNLGALAGKWVIYHKNGKLKQISTYDLKGKKLGDQKEYDVDGVLHGVYIYSNNKLTSYTMYDKKGLVVSSGKVKGGTLVYKAYYPDGKTLSAEGIFKDGMQEGEWKFYHKNNYLETKSQYSKGDLNGLTVDYYSNGFVASEKNYKSGIGDGLFKAYYRNKQLERIGYLVANQKQGYWLGYYPNGKKEYEYYYLNDEQYRYNTEYSATELKKREEYYEYGFVKFINHFDTLGTVSYTNNFPKGTGEYKTIYPNGKTKVQYQMKNGLIEGTLAFKYNNGKIEEIVKYVKGERVGEVKNFDEDGTLAVIGNYNHNQREGLWKYYYPNQKIESIGVYKNGSKDSLWIDYSENGTKDFDIIWDMGTYEGAITYYSPDLTNVAIFVRNFEEDVVKSYTYPGIDGKLIKTIPVYNETIDYKSTYPSGTKAVEYSIQKGHIEGPYKEYFSKDILHVEINYVGGMKEGKSTEYFLNGKISKEENYLYGEKDGVCKTYNANGTVKSIEVYVMGELNGTCMYYDQTGKLTKKLFYRDDIVY
jgi:antitoxin component YwqK of YwqJK toxin-antitoxin module